MIIINKLINLYNQTKDFISFVINYEFDDEKGEYIWV